MYVTSSYNLDQSFFNFLWDLNFVVIFSYYIARDYCSVLNHTRSESVPAIIRVKVFSILSILAISLGESCRDLIISQINQLFLCVRDSLTMIASIFVTKKEFWSYFEALGIWTYSDKCFLVFLTVLMSNKWKREFF